MEIRLLQDVVPVGFMLLHGWIIDKVKKPLPAELPYQPDFFRADRVFFDKQRS